MGEARVQDWTSGGLMKSPPKPALLGVVLGVAC